MIKYPLELNEIVRDNIYFQQIYVSIVYVLLLKANYPVMVEGTGGSEEVVYGNSCRRVFNII